MTSLAICAGSGAAPTCCDAEVGCEIGAIELGGAEARRGRALSEPAQPAVPLQRLRDASLDSAPRADPMAPGAGAAPKSLATVRVRSDLGAPMTASSA